MNLIDEHQTDLSDNLYKKLCDELKNIHNTQEETKPKKYIMHGVFCKLRLHYNEEHDVTEPKMEAVGVKMYVEVVEGSGYDIRRGKIHQDFFTEIASAVQLNGFYKDTYDYKNDTYFIINNITEI